MKKIVAKWKWIIVILIILWVCYFWYAQFFGSKTTAKETIIEATVKTWSIENSIKIIWSAQLVDEQKMRFNQNWKVAIVNFKDGDSVKKWDIIAELDKEDALNEIKQAEISLASSQVKLQELLKGPEQATLLKAQNDVSSNENKITVANQELSNLQQEKLSKIQDLQNQIENSKNNLQVAQEQLITLQTENQIKQSDTQNQIDAKTKEIDNKVSDLETTKKELDILIQQESKWLTDLDVDTAKLFTDSVTDAKKYIIDADTLLTNLDEIFWITDTNKYKNDAYEKYISVKNTQYKDQTQQLWINTKNKLESAKWIVNGLSSTETDWVKIKSALDEVKGVYLSMVDLGKAASNALQSSVSATDYPQSTIDAQNSKALSMVSQSQSTIDQIGSTSASLDKRTDPELQAQESQTNISKKRSEINSLQLSLDTQKTDLESLKNTYALNAKNYDINIKNAANKITEQQNSLNQQIKDLELQTKSLDTQLSSKQYDLDNLKASYGISQESLKETLRGSTQEQIQVARNDVAKQQIALENAKKNQDKYQLEAPFDGVVRKIDFKVWDNIVSDEEKYVYLENPNLIQLTATLDQLDIVNVHVWQQVRIIFDAYTNSQLTWVVEEVNSTPIESSWVTSYEVKITVDKWQFNIYSWMTAKLYIIIESKTNILTLPSAFITKRGNKSFVTQQTGTEQKQTEVVIGTTNSTESEIVSGLQPWDKVIRKVTTSSSTSTTQSILPSWWPWVGGAGWGSTRSFNR